MININKEDCCGCNSCMSGCPKKCIHMVEDKEGFRYPKVDKELCINCDKCVQVCPSVNPILKNVYESKGFAAKCNDDYIRFRSSSGGLFPVLASEIISNDGIVVGAIFDENFNVKHYCTNNISDLQKMCGSKYIQSNINEIYLQVKSFLDQGKQVYFSGTPCQIEGLYSFLGKKYEKLITQDLICHGVPSAKVWRKYLDSIGTPQDICFRDKSTGWKHYSFRIETINKKIFESGRKNIMMRAYLSNICLRPSCYNCKYKDKHRLSDITLGDFWGIENIAPEMDDDKGVSLIIIHSNIGDDLLNAIKDKISYKEIDLDQVIVYNPAIIVSSKESPKRKQFIEDLDNLELNKAVKKYCNVTFGKRVLNKLLYIIKKRKMI